MSRYKPKSTTPEVFFARNKLDGLLQNLLDNTGDSSPEQEEPLPEPNDVPGPSMLSLQSSPSKHQRGSASKSRKRRRIKEESETADIGQYHHTYVMKLFDRSVDLAQFEQDTPLYPICRAWMQNQPHNRNLAHRMLTPSPQPPEEEIEEDSENVYRMPSPVTIKQEISFETDYRDTRIPSPVPQPEEHLDISADPTLAPAPEQLLLNHMARWKTIRQKWKYASQHSEARFAPSMTLLRDMFDKQCKEQ